VIGGDRDEGHAEKRDAELGEPLCWLVDKCCRVADAAPATSLASTGNRFAEGSNEQAEVPAQIAR
jgi:hypothetical protein